MAKIMYINTSQWRTSSLQIPGGVDEVDTSILFYHLQHEDDLERYGQESDVILILTLIDNCVFVDDSISVSIESLIYRRRFNLCFLHTF